MFSTLKITAWPSYFNTQCFHYVKSLGSIWMGSAFGCIPDTLCVTKHDVRLRPQMWLMFRCSCAFPNFCPRNKVLLCQNLTVVDRLAQKCWIRDIGKSGFSIHTYTLCCGTQTIQVLTDTNRWNFTWREPNIPKSAWSLKPCFPMKKMQDLSIWSICAFLRKQEKKMRVNSKCGERIGWGDAGSEDGLFCKDKWRYSR